MRNYNCVSFAFKLEKFSDLCPVEDLDWRTSPVKAVLKFAKHYGLQCRKVEEENSPLEEGEWLVVFWGFIINYDPDDYSLYSCLPDYHFARKCKDGIWRERMRWGAPVEQVDLEKKINLFESGGYKPRFFAVKREAGV